MNTLEDKDTKVVKTTCGLCEIACAIDAHVEKGRLVKVKGMPEHVMSLLCIKGESMIDWEYSPERLQYPLKREDGGWKEISWEEALDFISSKLMDIKKDYGARGLAVSQGARISLRDTATYAKRFSQVYGTPNMLNGGSYCFFPKLIGNTLTFGHFAYSSFRGTRCVVLWGTNPNSSSHVAQFGVINAKRQGAKIIVVDPRRIPLAKKADIHAQLRPGTDAALALGMLKVIISEGLYDKKFVEEWTLGFDKLVDHLRGFSLEEAEKITWVPVETIKSMARMYAGSRPATVVQGLSLDPSTNAYQAIRSVSILIAITGNFDIPGGNTYQPMPPFYSSLDIPEEAPRERGFCADLYPIFDEISRAVGFPGTPVTPIAETLLTGKPYPIKGLIVEGHNPVATWANANKTREALKTLDLLVVIDLFMTETAQLAHIILPAASFLEITGLAQYGPYLPLITLHNKAVEPPGKCWPDWKIWFELARKMGYGKYFPWNGVEEALEDILKPMGITLEQLKKDPRGVFYGSKLLVKRYKQEGFNTPSGKVEIYSERLRDHGYDPLPTYKEPAESPLSRPDLAEKFPLIITTGVRVNAFTHSQLRHVKFLRQICPEPKAEIHPDTATKLGIRDGDPVIIESPRGSIRMQAHITDDILPQVVSIPHGWSGQANCNILTDDMERDPISCTPGYRSFLGRVMKG